MCSAIAPPSVDIIQWGGLENKKNKHLFMYPGISKGLIISISCIPACCIKKLQRLIIMLLFSISGIRPLTDIACAIIYCQLGKL